MFYNYSKNTETSKSKELKVLNEQPKQESNKKSSDNNLTKKMRNIFEQHVWWTRNYLITQTDKTADADVVLARLLQNPVDIGNIYKEYYGNDVAKKIADLFTTHLAIGGQIIDAQIKGDASAFVDYQNKWKQNATEIAQYLSSINKKYDEKVLNDMMQMHLDLTTAEIEDRVEGMHQTEIEVFDQVENMILQMADYLASGLE
ncbi:MAG: glycosyltransferase [Firmicutes bacterium]|nr:glycosyltransferase [Bacillota bacterium]